MSTPSESRPARDVRYPAPATTDFEGMTHAQLHAMLADANSGHVNALAEHLDKVAGGISDVAETLQRHINDLDLKGQGADAFHDWASQTVSATRQMSEYAKKASGALGHTSSAIGTAHGGMPPLSETQDYQADLKKLGAQSDPTPSTDKVLQIDSSRIEQTRQEAIAQMRKLASSYKAAGEQINTLQPPTYPPPANTLGEAWRGSNTYVSNPGDSGRLPISRGSSDAGPGSKSGAGERFAVTTATDTTGRLHSVGITGGSHSSPVQTTQLDSTASPAVAPMNPPTGHQPPPGQGPNGNPSQFPVIPPPSYGRQGGLVGSRPGGESFGGRFTGPGGEDLGPQKVIRPPIARDNGIVGGQRVETNNDRQTGLPRGTVIGHEQDGMSTGRSSMTGRSMGGLGRGGGSAGESGVVGGRRLAYESGGAVGGAPTGEEMNGKPFTPGGSGLVRGGADAEGEAQRESMGGRSGMMSGTRGHIRDPEEEHGQRPDYLKEDEETWEQGTGPTMRGVIE